MLQSLHIQNYALIDQLDITFDGGFSVITGETGAGKSILLGAIGLLLGQRADLRMLKAGAQRCIIEARFDLSPYHFENYFAQHDLDFDGSECIIRRELTATGKSRAFINDTPTSLADLKELGEQLIDIHSQHQNLLLNRQDFQLRVLDALAMNQPTRDEYEAKFEAYNKVDNELKTAKEEYEKGREEEDYIAFQLQQLEDAKLSEEEEEELEQELQTLEHAEEIKSTLYQAAAALEGEDNSLVHQLKETQRCMEAIAKVYPPAQQLAERLDSCYIEMRDIADEVEDGMERVEYDPERLNFVNERISLFHSLKQKFHKDDVSGLIALRDELAAQLSLIHNSDERLRTLQEQLDGLKQELARLSKELTRQRTAAARQLSKEMESRTTALGLPNLQFKVELTETPNFTGHGRDNVVFLFSANRNVPLQPLSQVASGGEISRLMLALKAIISSVEKLPTIIFDEIDTGVSGHIAERMAEMMRRMGSEQHRQVISITHLPQIAAFGSHHYRVYKTDEESSTTSHIVRLSTEERIEEIARMLSGSTLTQAAIDNAKALLQL